jgi:hypothetical protein
MAEEPARASEWPPTPDSKKSEHVIDSEQGKELVVTRKGVLSKKP